MKRIDILKNVISKQLEIISEIEKSVNQYKNASDIDEDDTIDPEDFSHQSEAKEMQLHFEQHLNKEKEKLILLESNKNFIDKIKIVISKNYVILLGVSFPKFENEKFYIGISESAPLYSKIINLEIGNQFNIGNQNEVILNIL